MASSVEEYAAGCVLELSFTPDSHDGTMPEEVNLEVEILEAFHSPSYA
jgi:hypothetical protein